MIKTMMLKAGRFRLPVQYIKSEGRLFLKFGYNKKLLLEIKSMEGQCWHGHEDGTYHELLRSVFGCIKCWSIADSPRNCFQLDFLQGKNVYARWEADIDISLCVSERSLFSHQFEMIAFARQMKYCIVAAEMGTGKSLAAIEVMEQSGHEDWWYVAPRSGLAAVERELSKWKSQIQPELMTYEGLVKRIAYWPDHAAPPKGLFLDEASKAKTPTAKRSKACPHLANAIREEHGFAGSVILMSGSPAPKSPADWWHLCEIAWPGFLKEGNRPKFEMRLGVFEPTETPQGSIFNKRVTWLDDPNKCQDCGQFKDCHSDASYSLGDHHFVKSHDEIAALNRRMKGLVKTWFKKDCLDLPEKVYRTIICEPMPSTLRAAQVIKQATPRAAQALILLRELSDGFQYTNIEDGFTNCTVCNGKKTIICPDTNIEIDCVGCGGSGSITNYTRVANCVKCPKDDALIGLLDEHTDIGRIIIYAGFQASVDRCCEIALKGRWCVVRWDGRGVKITGPDGPIIGLDPLDVFDDYDGRVAFIGQPGAAGMGLNLTASPTIVYYSNDFNAESRIQSEDRIHRPGCRGAQIIDLFHLPTDEMILTNLKEKRRIQDITMGEINASFA